MSSRISNPFITGGYLSPEYFCNREEETRRLLGAILSKRNITLISMRRIGKTGLLKHVKHLLEQEKYPPLVVYSDLMPTRNGGDMLNTLATALLQIKRSEKNFIEKLLGLFSALRPRLSFDSLTGQPVFSMTVESPADIQFGLQHLMDFIGEIKKEMVFMLDEFQQIVTYPEKNTEHILRSVFQTFPAISFVFSGSSKHMLEPMFSSASRPFYQSSDIMYLQKIKISEYGSFIREQLAKGGRSIDDGALKQIFDFTRLHTFHVQHVCNLLYEAGINNIGKEETGKTFHSILVSNEPLYVSYRNLLPSHQYKLLQAIAIENGVGQPTSGEFIRKYNLTSASSVNTSMKALEEKEMIVSENGNWFVYDVFFSRWLEYNYGK